MSYGRDVRTLAQTLTRSIVESLPPHDWAKAGPEAARLFLTVYEALGGQAAPPEPEPDEAWEPVTENKRNQFFEDRGYTSGTQSARGQYIVKKVFDNTGPDRKQKHPNFKVMLLNEMRQEMATQFKHPADFDACKQLMAITPETRPTVLATVRKGDKVYFGQDLAIIEEHAK